MENIDERDYIELEGEDGEVIKLDIVEYFEHKGEEYAILSDMTQLDTYDFDKMSEEEIEEAFASQEFYILQVITNGDTEEFVEPKEELMDELGAIAEEILNSDCDCDCEEEEDHGCGCGCHKE